MERFSKKRLAILECLRGTTEHPTAEWLHARLKPEYPDLSLATIYRNLSQLKAAGLVRSVGVVDGQERYDGNVQNHPHAVCTNCGRVLDLPCGSVSSDQFRTAQTATGFLFAEAVVQFNGLCPECQNSESPRMHGK